MDILGRLACRTFTDGSRRKKTTVAVVVLGTFAVLWLHSTKVTSPQAQSHVLQKSVSHVTLTQSSLVTSQKDRYMIYKCDKSCGGWADRVKGIVIAYVFSSLTNRRFGIEIKSMPCKLTSFLEPREVPWNLTLDRRDRAEAKLFSVLDSVAFYNTVSTINLDHYFKRRVIYFKANLDYFDLIKRNPLYMEQLAWMQPLTRDQIFAEIYRRLFRFSPSVQEVVNRTLENAKPGGSDNLVCAHLRMASNAEHFMDSQARHTVQHGDTVLSFLRQFDNSRRTMNTEADSLGQKLPAAAQSYSPLPAGLDVPHFPASSTVRFFVTSDSAAFVEKAARAFGPGFVRTEGRVVHVDRAREAACDGFTKVLVDQELLAQCDVLVISKSGLSRQAAYRRGTSRGLYCILMSGALVKCEPHQLKELYKIRG